MANGVCTTSRMLGERSPIRNARLETPTAAATVPVSKSHALRRFVGDKFHKQTARVSLGWLQQTKILIDKYRFQMNRHAGINWPFILTSLVENAFTRRKPPVSPRICKRV